MLRGGIGGIIIIIALIYFTGAGTWLWNNVKQLDTNCYTSLSRTGPKLSGAICGAVSKGIGAMDNGLTSIGDKFRDWKSRVFGSASLDNMTFAINDRLTRFASSNDVLTKMMQAGPSNFGNSARQSVQQAIDSFTIGQGYLKQGGSSEALQWFQRGAQQPQGYGLMSQMSLGNMYMTGQGVPQNNQAAQVYLQQASNSITQLMGSNTPQSQQLLQTLPGSPQQVKAQLEQAIRQLSAATNKK